MISKEDIDRIFDIVRLEDVVMDFVSLKKSGTNYKGLSPFSNEKTPSFVVSPTKQIWKDFSSGKGGNVVSFLIELENFSYPEALRYLAKKYGIDLKENELTNEERENQTQKESIYIIHEKVQKRFLENINSDLGNGIALSYMRERGLRDDIIYKFGIGYALNSYNDISSLLIKMGYPKELIQLSGVSFIKNENLYDRFRERIMFPIHSFSGRIIGFGARTLSKKIDEVKYLNSPETLIYNKSKSLYGIYFSKNAISRLDSCILLEGYMDVISFYQKGIKNVVSSSGTSLTKDQCNIIKRLTNNVTIIYDGDNAGIKASIRSINILLEEGINVSLVSLPDDEDPDSFSKKLSSDELVKYINDNTVDFVTFMVKINNADIEKNPIKKSQILKSIIDSISLIKNPIDRELFIQKTSKILDVSTNSIFNQISLADLNSSKQNKRELKYTVNRSKVQYLEKHKNYNLELDVLNILLNFSDEKDEQGLYIYDFILDEFQKEQIIFEDNINKEIINTIIENYKLGKRLDFNFFYRDKNQDIVNRVIDISFKIEKIDSWDKRNIIVSNYSEKIPKESIDIVRKFKLEKIEKLILEETQKLEYIDDHSKIQYKITLILKLTELRDEIKNKIFNGF